MHITRQNVSNYRNKNKRTRFKCYFDGFAEAIKDNSSRDINNRDINLFMSLIQAKKYLKN